MVELSPTVRKWAVAEGLKYMRLRYVETAGMKAGSQGAVAEKIQRKRASVGHWEEGRSLPDHNDIEAALTLYGYARHIDEFRELSMVSRGEREWWDGTAPRDFLPEGQKSFLAFEHSATRIFAYDPQLVPDLLQTREYAERVLRLERPAMNTTELNLSLDLLAQRQERVQRKSELHSTWFIDEAALRREVGGREVLRDQIERLIEAGRPRNVNIHVLPFWSSGRAATRAGFTSLTLPLEFEALTEVVYSRTIVEYVRYHEVPDLEVFTRAREQLEPAALNRKQSREFLENLLAELG